jgi:uncharacterized protein
MTEQEQQMITGLAERIRNAPAPQVDRDADELIRRTIGARPDALYVLTQTVLIQEMALNQAKTQIEQLRQQGSYQQNSQQSFLPGQVPAGYQQSRYQDSGYAPAPPPPPPPSGGGFSNFLHNAATTAAGVIAGQIAFDSLASLFGHRGGGMFGGGGFLGDGGIMPGSETIVNNYYDDRGDGGDGSRFADAADQNQDVSSDIDDERDNSGDSFVDDGSSYDDGGSSDV